MSQNGTNDTKTLKLASSKPRRRCLVVMFDGTSNTRQSMTNVSRMFEAIDDSLPDSYTPPGVSKVSTKFFQCTKCRTFNQPMLESANHEGDDSKAYYRVGVQCRSCHQLVMEPELPVQLVKYITGVGTSYGKPIGRLTGQTFGYGLSRKIKEGYTWLCENYQSKEDLVFVFGFSRGPFSARSLVSLLDKCDGVLRKTPESLDHNDVIEKAYKYYESVKRMDIENNEAQKRSDFIKYLRDKNIEIEPLHVQVKMLGVWDTVGALGIRFNTGWSIIDGEKNILSQKHYAFHEQGLPCIVENAYHALALDEYREHFTPTLWTSRASEKQEVKQVWFAGSHCNVGGGADLNDNTDPDDLWQYSYVWMQQHAERHGLQFYWNYQPPATRDGNSQLRPRRLSLRKPEPSYKNFVHGIYSRVVNQYVRKADPKLAMLHWSVVERIKFGKANWVEAEKKPSVLQKIGNLFSKMFSFLYSGRSSKGVGPDPPKPTEYLLPKSLVEIHKYDEFMATVIPEGSTEVIAPEVAALKWHIDTDDAAPCLQWGLPVPPKATKKLDKKLE